MNKTLLLKCILYSPLLVTMINHSHSAVEFNPLIGKPLLNISQQGTRNTALELNRKGLCLQEFTILLDFSVKSLVALKVSTDTFHRFQEKVVQKKTAELRKESQEFKSVD